MPVLITVLLDIVFLTLVGNLLKSAVKFNIDIDLNNDNKKDGKINIDLKEEFKLLDFFSDDKKSKEELVFIFDDLERTEINLKEVLGYINYLVEQSNFKVIIVANEEKIDSSFYKEFKEKVIGKTFEIEHDFKEVLNYFIEKKTDISKKILKENTQIIEDIYRKARYNNLRHIAQILLDFEYFIKKIDEKYLKNKEFISILIKIFFAISIELKSGNLTKEELLKKEDQSSLDKKEKTAIEKIYEKYDVKRYLLFEGKEWVKILLDNSITKEELNNLISDTIFFKKDKRSSWVKLWYYTELSDKEFANIIEDVISKFKKCEYEIPEHFIHVIALLIFFRKNKLCELTIEDIKSQVENCIKKYHNNENWKSRFIKDSSINRTGLEYINKEDKDFQEIFKIVLKENKLIYQEAERNKIQQLIEKFLESLKKFDEEFLKYFLLREYSIKPIFNNIDSNNFVKILIEMENKNIVKFHDILSSRYADTNYFNNKKNNCYLTEELDFWKSVYKNLNNILQNRKKPSLKTLILSQFNDSLKNEIINELEEYLQSKKSNL